ncbi:secondary thiamine-phosphate synthase enzyme YjbQ [bacterium]|nr:secondary thiamine-phosphate synthase enzyme YjbQ [bacterium]
MKVINVRTDKRNQMLDITSQIKEVLIQSGVKNGICTLYVPHTTAAVTINEGADPDVKLDITTFMAELIPNRQSFKHAEGNSDSHIKTSLFGPSETIIIQDSKLVLGTWQVIYFCEFDGPRSRKLYIKIMGD